MKKSLVRWSATLGLLGTTLMGSSLLGNMPAVALPEAQIIPKLQPVPVFTITDAQGAPLVASVDNGPKKGAVAGVFISQKDAQAFIDRLNKEKPDLAKTVKVVPVSLAEVYKLAQANKDKKDALDFAYVPVQQQVQSAVTLLRQSDPKVQQFAGVPLFAARGGKDKGYLTIQQDNKPVIPFFFDKEQLQSMVDRFKQQQPAMASTIEIQVVPLEGVIQTLKSSNNQQLNNIMLIPSRESMQFLQSLPASGPAQTRPQQRR